MFAPTVFNLLPGHKVATGHPPGTGDLSEEVLGKVIPEDRGVPGCSCCHTPTWYEVAYKDVGLSFEPDAPGHVKVELSNGESAWLPPGEWLVIYGGDMDYYGDCLHGIQRYMVAAATVVVSDDGDVKITTIDDAYE